jgi:hypothetical protein
MMKGCAIDNKDVECLVWIIEERVEMMISQKISRLK